MKNKLIRFRDSVLRLFWQFRAVFVYYGVHIGKNAIVKSNVRFSNRSKISIGENSIVSDCCEISAGNHGNVIIGQSVHIADRTVLRSFSGDIRIGDHVLVNYGCIVFGDGGISIGANSKLGPYCVLAASNHNFTRTDIPIREQGNTSKGIALGEDCWLGAHCTVLDGVKIGKGCVVGAGAVVSNDLPDYSVAVGVPARVIRTRQ